MTRETALSSAEGETPRAKPRVLLRGLAAGFRQECDCREFRDWRVPCEKCGTGWPTKAAASAEIPFESIVPGANSRANTSRANAALERVANTPVEDVDADEVPTPAANRAERRKAYMRDLMKKRRAERKAKP